MSFKDDISGALLELQDELADEDGNQPFFVWKGANVACVPNMLEASSSLVIGGMEVTFYGSLHVLKSVFLSADSTLVSVDSELYTVDNGKPHPVAGRLLTFRGKSRRILSVTEDSSRAFYVLKLISPNQ